MSRILQRLKLSVLGATMAATLVGVGGALAVTTAIAASQAMTTTGAVNMRSGPSTSNTILMVVPKGAAVTGTGTTSGGWTQVTYAGKTGYISTAYLTVTATADAPVSSAGATGTRTTTANVNVRSGPATTSSVVAVAAKGTAVKLTGAVSGTWSQVVWGGTNRWIATSYLTAASAATATTYGQVKTTANLNMRTSGSLDGAIVGVLPANSLVDVTGNTTTDYVEILFKGQKVWISNKYITAVTSAPTLLSSTITAKQATLVKYASSKVGGPYVWGGEGPTGYDCSGLTMMAYRQIGISLPHHAADQINLGTAVAKANLQPGDLIFWYSPVSHVSMYIGDGMMVHARNTTVGIVKQTVASYISGGGTYVGARRYTS